MPEPLLVVENRGCPVILRGPAYLVQVLTIGASHLICQFPRTGVGAGHDENLAALLALDFLLHGLRHSTRGDITDM